MSVRNTVKSIQDIMRQDSGVDGDAQRISQLCWMFFLKIIDDQDQQLELMQDGYHSPIPEKLQWRAWAADPEGITGEELLTFINTKLFPQLKELSVAGKQSDRRRVIRDVFEDAYNYMKSGQLMRQVVNKINEVDFNNLAERQHFGDIYEQILNDLQSAGNAGEYYTPRAVTAFMADRIDPHPGEILLDPACGTGGFLTCSLRHMRERYVKKVEDEQRMQGALRAVEKKQLPHMLCVTNMLLHGIENPSFVRHDNTLARPYISYTQSDRVDIVLTNPPFGGREEDGIESNFPKHFQTRETADLFLALIIRILKVGGRAAVVLPDGSLFGEGVKTRLKEHLMEECNLHTIVRLPNSVFKPYASIGTNLLFFEKGEPTKDIWFYEHRVPDGQKAYSMTKPIRIEHLKPCIDWWGGAKRKGRAETEVAWKVTADEVKARGYNLDFKNPHSVVDDHDDPDELLARLDEAETQAGILRDELRTILAEALAAMNPGLLIAHFNRISEGPNAIPRLRSFILGLAVRGKLVPQAPGDEPASELIKRIQTEKARLVKDGKMRLQPTLPAIDTSKTPFRLPASWDWVRFGELITGADSGWSPKTENFPRLGDNWGVLKVSAVSWNKFLPGENKQLLPGTAPPEAAQVHAGDFLISRANTSELVAKCVVVEHEAKNLILSDKIVRLQLFESCSKKFLSMVNNHSAHARAYYAEEASGTSMSMQNVSRAVIYALLIPLPPLAEQHRIVAKVDELMALCNLLEAQLTSAQIDTSRLLEAVLYHALSDPPVSEELLSQVLSR